MKLFKKILLFSLISLLPAQVTFSIRCDSFVKEMAENCAIAIPLLACLYNAIESARCFMKSMGHLEPRTNWLTGEIDATPEQRKTALKSLALSSSRWAAVCGLATGLIAYKVLKNN